MIYIRLVFLTMYRTWPFLVELLTVVPSVVEVPSAVEVLAAADCQLVAGCPAKTSDLFPPLGWSFSVGVGLNHICVSLLFSKPH